MSEKSDQRGDRSLLTQPDQSNRAGDDAVPTQHGGAQTAGADKVGRGHPPRNTQWKKGCRSPNPRGRPRKEQSPDTDLRKVYLQAINKKFPVSRGGKKVLMTRFQAGIEQRLNAFATGDRHAGRELLQWSDKLGIDLLAQHKQAIEQALSPSHQAILDSALARLSGTNAAPVQRVLAPPELLDDDRVEPAPTPSPAADQVKVRPATAPTPPIPSRPSVTAQPMSTASPASVKAPAASVPASALIKPPSEPTKSLPPGKVQTAAMLAPPPVKPQPTATASASPVQSRPAPIRYPGLATAPAAPTRPRPPDPEPKPEVSKPFARMLWTEIRAQYPEWWAEYVKWCAEQGIYL